MQYERWYPTVTALPDGRMLVTGGETNCNECNALIPEVYNPATNTWTQLTGASKEFPYYPHMFVLPDGRVLATSSNRRAMATVVLNLATQTWSTVDPAILDGGSAAMYAPGKILYVGGGDPPTNTAEIIDLNQPNPAWTYTGSMAFARRQMNATLLPTGDVLVTGGTSGGGCPAHSR